MSPNLTVCDLRDLFFLSSIQQLVSLCFGTLAAMCQQMVCQFLQDNRTSNKNLAFFTKLDCILVLLPTKNQDEEPSLRAFFQLQRKALAFMCFAVFGLWTYFFFFFFRKHLKILSKLKYKFIFVAKQISYQNTCQG